MSLRLQRLTRNGTWIMVPVDHGTSMGPVPGLIDPVQALQGLDAATCITAHRGLIPRIVASKPRAGLLMHLSASTDIGPDPLDKRLVATVEDAVRATCDGVSIHVNVGSPYEARQIEDAGRVATACAEWNMPLVTMAYPRGPGIDPLDPDAIAHAARLAAELGADAVKVPYTGHAETFAPVVEGAGIPVLVAGGPRRETVDALVADLRGAREAGAAGVSIGRNVFQAKHPQKALQAIASVWP